MPTSPLSPKLIKGALVELTTRFIGVVPNVIVFQYNPETMTRKLEPWYAGGSEGGKSGTGSDSVNAQPFDPPESLDLKIRFDAADDLEQPLSHPTAVIAGVADRIAALEMLLYPQEESLASALMGSVGESLGGAIARAEKFLGGSSMPVPRGKVPDVLFVWGPGRVVPVRLTSFSVDEQAYSPTLFVLRAEVTIGLKIIDPRNIPCAKSETSKLSIAAYKIYRRQKQALAAANILKNAADTAFGALPF
jgi:hypothetical protein